MEQYFFSPAERAEEISAAAQDQVRNLQQSGGHDEETEKEVEGREQEWTGHGQRAEEYADSRGREVQAGRLLWTEFEECKYVVT